MTGYLKPYRSYVFRGKDPVIDILRTAIKDSGKSYQEVADESGVAVGTLSNWFSGPTERPKFSTVNAVARSLEKEFILVDSKHVVRKSPRAMPHLKLVTRG